MADSARMLLDHNPEWSRYVALRVVGNLAGLIRRWFNVEITFVDKTGYVRAYDSGRVFTPANAVCRAVLGHRDGFKSCLASSQEAFEAMRKSKPKGGASVAAEPSEHTCHLGFRMLTVPIIVDKKIVGAVVASGLVPEGSREALLERVRTNGATLGVQEEVAAQVQTLPVVDESRVALFAELLAEIVKEIETYHRELHDREEAIRRLKEELSGRYAFGAIIGKSKVMRDVFSLIEKVASSESTVLIQGENGTGKELIARAIHYNSTRRDRPFVIQSGAGFNENLLESELFGHVRGSFTGAIKDKKGLFEVADGGTFFLDEIGEMSPTLQVKLLRVLQEGTFIPVGGTEPRRVDVRLVCATNRDLKRMVERGEFREDLYYRINVIHVQIPPLRERREDLPLLTDHFVSRFTAERGKPPKRMSEEVMQRFFDYDWPGNVRELENEIERLVVLGGDEEEVNSDLLSARIRERSMRANVKGVRVQKTLPEILEEVEKRVLLEGLRRTRWNKSQLAKELGISRKGLIAKVARYRLDRRRERN